MFKTAHWTVYGSFSLSVSPSASTSSRLNRQAHRGSHLTFLLTQPCWDPCILRKAIASGKPWSDQGQVAITVCWPCGLPEQKKAGVARKAERCFFCLFVLRKHEVQQFENVGLYAFFKKKKKKSQTTFTISCLKAKKTRDLPCVFLANFLSMTSLDTHLLTALAHNQRGLLGCTWVCAVWPGTGKGIVQSWAPIPLTREPG